MKIIFKKLLKKIQNLIQSLNRDWEDKSLIINARILMKTNSWKEYNKTLDIKTKEFRVYSQWGDDGIIQYLIHILNIQNKQFIEFGVGDFFESNSHFLLVNNNWSGFVIDGSEKNIKTLKSSPFFWRYDLVAKAAFIDRDNINDLLLESNFEDLGILHIDLDGNDYWILSSIDFNRFNPDILILEYNSNFGSERKITVPYDRNFSCLDAHYSGQYFGASLSALEALSKDLGYFLIGCNSAGNNAYFIKNKYSDIISPKSVVESFAAGKFRDERNKHGNLLLSNRSSSIEAIRGLPVFNIMTQEIEDF